MLAYVLFYHFSVCFFVALVGFFSWRQAKKETYKLAFDAILEIKAMTYHAPVPKSETILSKVKMDEESFTVQAKDEYTKGQSDIYAEGPDRLIATGTHSFIQSDSLTLTSPEPEAHHPTVDQQLQHGSNLPPQNEYSDRSVRELGTLLFLITRCCELLQEKPSESDEIRNITDLITTASHQATSITRLLIDNLNRGEWPPPKSTADDEDWIVEEFPTSFSYPEKHPAEGLFDLSHVEKNIFDKTPANESCDLATIVSSYAPVIQSLLGPDRSLVLSVVNRTVEIAVNPLSISQVLLNLAVNSRDAMPHGGTFAVDVELAEASDYIDSRKGQMALLTVSDTGVGMDAETLSQAFEPFFSTKVAGSGMGLSTVADIVSMAGGIVIPESNPKIGTTIRFLFPLVENMRLKQGLQHKDEFSVL